MPARARKRDHPSFPKKKKKKAHAFIFTSTGKWPVLSAEKRKNVLSDRQRIYPKKKKVKRESLSR